MITHTHTSPGPAQKSNSDTHKHAGPREWARMLTKLINVSIYYGSLRRWEFRGVWRNDNNASSQRPEWPNYKLQDAT